MPHLPESALPELRARWLKLAGAKEVAEHAVSAARTIEAEYTGTLHMVLRMLEIDPALNWQINLETGEIAEALPNPVNGNGLAAPSVVPG